MAFDNFRSILQVGSISSSYKLLLLAASYSRPKYRWLCFKLLRPFVRNGEIALRYRCYGRSMRFFVRLSDLDSDFRSVLELGIRDTYDLDLGFKPDLVIDGGGNIGLFTLRAAAAIGSASDSPARFVICEPLPRNVEQVEKHIRMNRIPAEIRASCIGGASGSIPFYCREAIHSSFDPGKPYTSVIDMPVETLHDVIGSAPAERILIKLDIEGMEIETLRTFVPSERRAVYIVGELHNYQANWKAFERIFNDCGWTCRCMGLADEHANFQACSPAALPLLPSIAESSSSIDNLASDEVRIGDRLHCVIARAAFHETLSDSGH